MKVTEQELEQRLEWFKATARRAGLKLTRQRLEIFRAVAASADHPDAETVLAAVRERLPGLSLDTVYRALWVLEELGVVHTLGPRRERTRFDANLSQHHHYVCVRCGLTRDFSNPALDALSAPEAHDFGTAERTCVEVRGVCHECAAPAGDPAANPAVERPKGPKRRA